MDNPWKHIDLGDYENHMQLESVQQLQVMNKLMRNQFYCYHVPSVVVLGIAGGNGLNHIDPDKFNVIWGVDINGDYLAECKKRYPALKRVFNPIEADLTDVSIVLPHAQLVIANLLVEYIGYHHFKRIIKLIDPTYISAVIQINTNSSFVSDSPYLHVFDDLEEIHHQISESELTTNLNEIGYTFILRQEVWLPNEKKLLRVDYQKIATPGR